MKLSQRLMRIGHTWEAARDKFLFSPAPYVFDSLDPFLNRNKYPDGTYRIYLNKELHLDVLLKGNPLRKRRDSRIPVFFTGAVTYRSTAAPPFFSGRNILEDLRIGVVAFSDPIFNISDDITVGWYTGIPGAYVQEAIGKILNHFKTISRRELLCIGGSAGGFAAIEAAVRTHSAAFVWNSQTSIFEYVAQFVHTWLSVLFPDKWVKNARWKVLGKQLVAHTEIIADVTQLPMPSQLLYVQNDTDWHVHRHLVPYVSQHSLPYLGSGVFSDEGNHTVSLAHFGDGHATPDKTIIRTAVEHMLKPDANTYDVYRELDLESDVSLEFLPQNLISTPHEI